MGMEMMKLATRATLTAALLACTASICAQTPATPTTARHWAFDIVSIKPSHTTDPNASMRLLPDGQVATNVSITMLLQNAYGIKPDLISGLPGWAQNARFDLEARVSPEDAEAFSKLGRQERFVASQKMMQAVLADRFQVKAHIESRQLPVFDLVLAKSGPKLREVKPTDTDGVKDPEGKRSIDMFHFDGTSFTAQGLQIPALANNLGYRVHRTVVDKTGLKGRYDFTLKFTPETNPTAADNTAPDDPPPLFTALEEQLGLKLVPSKGPTDTLVVDHVAQPTEN